MSHLASLHPPRAALTAALAAAGLLGGVPAAHAAVTFAYSDSQLTATSDAAGDTMTVKNGSGRDGVAIQALGTAAVDPDGADDECTASGDTVECSSVDFVEVRGAGGDDTVTDTRTDGFASFRVDGGEGEDTLTSASSRYYNSSTLIGGSGNDVLTGGTSRDVFSPGPGADKVRGGSAPTDPAVEPYKSFLEEGGEPADYQRSYGYDDSVFYPVDGPGVSVTLDDQANDGAAGEGDDIGSDVERVHGTNAADTLTAGAASSVEFRGLLGNDTLTGGPGNDDLNGGGDLEGNGDGSGSDTLNGNGGNDSLRDDDSSPYSDPFPGEPARTPAGADTLNGGDGDDEFVTDAGADDIIGGAGRDTAYGFNRFGPRPVNAPDGFVRPKLGFTITLDNVANDGQSGAGEGDNVHADIESVFTGSGDDSITGSGGPDELNSGSGNDTLTGGGGADILEAGSGNDALYVQDGVTDRADGGRGSDSAVADLGGGQPDKADVLFNVESITGTPLPAVIDATKIPTPPVTPPNRAPTVAVTGLKIKSAPFLKTGRFSLRVTTDEPSRVVADLLGKSRYRAVGDLVIGTGRLALGAGRRTVKVSVGKTNLRTFKRKLRTKARRRKGISLKVRIAATDAQGLATTVTRTVKIKG